MQCGCISNKCSFKNIMSVVIMLCLLGLSAATSTELGAPVVNEDFIKIDGIQQEPPCTVAGGICTIAADCPSGHLSETRGLCPQQKSKGIECCHGISMKETRCHQHGGTCMAHTQHCHPQLVYMAATDCTEDTRCCIMT